MDRRTDRHSEIFIQAVLNGLARAGYDVALEAMLDIGIARGTAVRVLTRPAERRSFKRPYWTK